MVSNELRPCDFHNMNNSNGRIKYNKYIKYNIYIIKQKVMEFYKKRKIIVKLSFHYIYKEKLNYCFMP